MSVSEKGKKFLSFVFLTSAINRRNTTSIGLVILFMIVYAVSGGKIFWAPKIKGGEGFGTVQSSTGIPARNSSEKSGAIKFSGDVVDNVDSKAKNSAKKSERNLFGSYGTEQKKKHDADHAPVNTGSESLSELQQRLDRLNVDRRNK